MNQLADPIDLAEARSHFPALERWTYMDVAARGVLSREVRAAIDAHLDERTYSGYTDKERWFALAEEARARFARLIGADADDGALRVFHLPDAYSPITFTTTRLRRWPSNSA